MDFLVLINGEIVQFVTPSMDYPIKVRTAGGVLFNYDRAKLEFKVDSTNAEFFLKYPLIRIDNKENKSSVCVINYCTQDFMENLEFNNAVGTKLYGMPGILPKNAANNKKEILDNLIEDAEIEEPGTYFAFIMNRDVEQVQLSQVHFVLDGDIEQKVIGWRDAYPAPGKGYIQQPIKFDGKKINDVLLDDASYVVNGLSLDPFLDILKVPYLVPNEIYSISTDFTDFPATITRFESEKTVVAGLPGDKWKMKGATNNDIYFDENLVLTGNLSGDVVITTAAKRSFALKVITNSQNLLRCARCSKSYTNENNYHGACQWHTRHARGQHEAERWLVTIDTYKHNEEQPYSNFLAQVPKYYAPAVETKIRWLLSHPTRINFERSPADMHIGELRKLIPFYRQLVNSEEREIREYARVAVHILDQRPLEKCLDLPYYDPADPLQKMTHGFRNPNVRFGISDGVWQCCGFPPQDRGCWIGKHSQTVTPDLQDITFDIRGTEHLNDPYTSSLQYAQIAMAKQANDYEKVFLLESQFNGIHGGLLIVPDTANGAYSSAKNYAKKLLPNAKEQSVKHMWVRDEAASIEFRGIVSQIPLIERTPQLVKEAQLAAAVIRRERLRESGAPQQRRPTYVPQTQVTQLTIPKSSRTKRTKRTTLKPQGQLKQGGDKSGASSPKTSPPTTRPLLTPGTSPNTSKTSSTRTTQTSTQIDETKAMEATKSKLEYALKEPYTLAHRIYQFKLDINLQNYKDYEVKYALLQSYNNLDYTKTEIIGFLYNDAVKLVIDDLKVFIDKMDAARKGIIKTALEKPEYKDFEFKNIVIALCEGKDALNEFLDYINGNGVKIDLLDDWAKQELKMWKDQFTGYWNNLRELLFPTSVEKTYTDAQNAQLSIIAKSFDMYIQTKKFYPYVNALVLPFEEKQFPNVAPGYTNLQYFIDTVTQFEDEFNQNQNKTAIEQKRKFRYEEILKNLRYPVQGYNDIIDQFIENDIPGMPADLDQFEKESLATITEIQTNFKKFTKKFDSDFETYFTQNMNQFEQFQQQTLASNLLLFNILKQAFEDQKIPSSANYFDFLIATENFEDLNNVESIKKKLGKMFAIIFTKNYVQYFQDDEALKKHLLTNSVLYQFYTNPDYFEYQKNEIKEGREIITNSVNDLKNYFFEFLGSSLELQKLSDENPPEFDMSWFNDKVDKNVLDNMQNWEQFIQELKSTTQNKIKEYEATINSTTEQIQKTQKTILNNMELNIGMIKTIDGLFNTFLLRHALEIKILSYTTLKELENHANTLQTYAQRIEQNKSRIETSMKIYEDVLSSDYSGRWANRLNDVQDQDIKDQIGTYESHSPKIEQDVTQFFKNLFKLEKSNFELIEKWDLDKVFEAATVSQSGWTPQQLSEYNTLHQTVTSKILEYKIKEATMLEDIKKYDRSTRLTIFDIKTDEFKIEKEYSTKMQQLKQEETYIYKTIEENMGILQAYLDQAQSNWSRKTRDPILSIKDTLQKIGIEFIKEDLIELDQPGSFEKLNLIYNNFSKMLIIEKLKNFIEQVKSNISVLEELAKRSDEDIRQIFRILHLFESQGHTEMDKIIIAWKGISTQEEFSDKIVELKSKLKYFNFRFEDVIDDAEINLGASDLVPKLKKYTEQSFIKLTKDQKTLFAQLTFVKPNDFDQTEKNYRIYGGDKTIIDEPRIFVSHDIVFYWDTQYEELKQRVKRHNDYLTAIEIEMKSFIAEKSNKLMQLVKTYNEETRELFNRQIKNPLLTVSDLPYQEQEKLVQTYMDNLDKFYKMYGSDISNLSDNWKKFSNLSSLFDDYDKIVNEFPAEEDMDIETIRIFIDENKRNKMEQKIVKELEILNFGPENLIRQQIDKHVENFKKLETFLSENSLEKFRFKKSAQEAELAEQKIKEAQRAEELAEAKETYKNLKKQYETLIDKVVNEYKFKLNELETVEDYNKANEENSKTLESMKTSITDAAQDKEIAEDTKAVSEKEDIRNQIKKYLKKIKNISFDFFTFKFIISTEKYQKIEDEINQDLLQANEIDELKQVLENAKNAYLAQLFRCSEKLSNYLVEFDVKEWFESIQYYYEIMSLSYLSKDSRFLTSVGQKKKIFPTLVSAYSRYIRHLKGKADGDYSALTNIFTKTYTFDETVKLNEIQNEKFSDFAKTIKDLDAFKKLDGSVSIVYSELEKAISNKRKIVGLPAMPIKLKPNTITVTTTTARFYNDYVSIKYNSEMIRIYVHAMRHNIKDELSLSPMRGPTLPQEPQATTEESEESEEETDEPLEEKVEGSESEEPGFESADEEEEIPQTKSTGTQSYWFRTNLEENKKIVLGSASLGWVGLEDNNPRKPWLRQIPAQGFNAWYLLSHMIHPPQFYSILQSQFGKRPNFSEALKSIEWKFDFRDGGRLYRLNGSNYDIAYQSRTTLQSGIIDGEGKFASLWEKELKYSRQYIIFNLNPNDVAKKSDVINLLNSNSRTMVFLFGEQNKTLFDGESYDVGKASGYVLVDKKKYDKKEFKKTIKIFNDANYPKTDPGASSPISFDTSELMFSQTSITPTTNKGTASSPHQLFNSATRLNISLKDYNDMKDKADQMTQNIIKNWNRIQLNSQSPYYKDIISLKNHVTLRNTLMLIQTEISDKINLKTVAKLNDVLGLNEMPAGLQDYYPDIKTIPLPFFVEDPQLVWQYYQLTEHYESDKYFIFSSLLHADPKAGTYAERAVNARLCDKVALQNIKNISRKGYTAPIPNKIKDKIFNAVQQSNYKSSDNEGDQIQEVNLIVYLNGLKRHKEDYEIFKQAIADIPKYNNFKSPGYQADLITALETPQQLYEKYKQFMKTKSDAIWQRFLISYTNPFIVEQIDFSEFSRVYGICLVDGEKLNTIGHALIKDRLPDIVKSFEYYGKSFDENESVFEIVELAIARGHGFEKMSGKAFYTKILLDYIAIKKFNEIQLESFCACLLPNFENALYVKNRSKVEGYPIIEFYQRPIQRLVEIYANYDFIPTFENEIPLWTLGLKGAWFQKETPNVEDWIVAYILGVEIGKPKDGIFTNGNIFGGNGKLNILDYESLKVPFSEKIRTGKLIAKTEQEAKSQNLIPAPQFSDIKDKIIKTKYAPEILEEYGITKTTFLPFISARNPYMISGIEVKSISGTWTSKFLSKAEPMKGLLEPNLEAIGMIAAMRLAQRK